MSDKQYILSLIAQGEHDHQDFKFQINDARKIARSLSAFANNDGGHLLVGVKDNGVIAGVKSDEEIYMIEQAAQLYCRPEQRVTFKVYQVDGRQVVLADIAAAKVKPVKAPDEHGQWKAYYRVADENILASSLHLRVMRRHTREADNAVVAFSPADHLLLDYLRRHGAISITGYTKLAHISRTAAEQSVLGLCDMHIVTIDYHDGQCVVVLNNQDDNIHSLQ